MEYSFPISVVIPAYNAGKYIGECLDSLLAQTYDNMEILVVDDGSADDTAHIVGQYSAKSLTEGKGIRLVSQKNQGPFLARKNGCIAASGEYILFVDADDTVDTTYVAEYMQYAGKADLVTGGCKKELSNGDIVIRQDGLPLGYYDSMQKEWLVNNMIYCDQRDKEGILTYCVGKLYKKDLINRIFANRSVATKIEEDSVFIWEYIINSKSVLVTDINSYNYIFHKSSSINSVNEQYMFNINEFYLTAKEIFKAHNCSVEAVKKLQRFTNKCIIMASRHMGFDWQTETIRYIPGVLRKLVVNKRVAIYGAGIVGKQYYRLFSQLLDDDRLYWTDKNWEKISQNIPMVESLAGMKDFMPEIIIVAATNEDTANSMAGYLEELGYDKACIFWDPPINIGIL